MAREPLRILGINAHPHDFTHYAATLGIHTSLGDSVTVVSMTSGASIHNERLEDELAKPPEERDMAIINQLSSEYTDQKAAEMRSAAALFGITDVRILDFPDQPFNLQRYPEAVDKLVEIILDVRPHVMIPQSPYLRGPRGLTSGARDDHTETAFASLEARALAGTPRGGSTKPPHTIAATYFPGVYFEQDQFDFVVDISEWFEQRVEAEATYESQGHTPAFARRRIEIGTGRVGWFAGIAYGEAFVREKPELVSRITVPEAMLEHAAEPESRHLARIAGEPKEAARG